MNNQFFAQGVPLPKKSIFNKKITTILAIVAGLVALYFLVFKVFFQPVLISVNAVSEIKVAPEKALFSVSNVSVEGTAQGAISRNKQQTQDIITILERNGVLDEDISYSYPAVSGLTTQGNYQSSSAINVSVNNLAVLDDLIAELYSVGVSSISEIYFTVNNPEEVEERVTDQALKKAKKRAREIARSSGKLFGFGKVVSVTVEEAGEVASSGGDISRLDELVSAQPSQITVNRQASIVFEAR